jgi:spore coat protein U-like protein
MPGDTMMTRIRQRHLPRVTLIIMASLLPGMATAECLLNVVGVNFGNYDTMSLTDAEITGSIGVSCDEEASLQISLSAGLGGSFATRQLQSGPRILFYNLYLDPSHLTIWGDGSPGTGVLSLSGTGGNFPVYGRIPARQNVPVGPYGDTLHVTLVF